MTATDAQEFAHFMVEREKERNTQRPERAVAVRRLDTQIEAGDGRTISFRIAPFGELATCADGLGGLPRGVPYQEELLPGLYDKQLRAANRVLLNFEHQQGIAGVVGHGVDLAHRSDGYHGTFRIHDSADGDKTLMLVREGVLQGASVESYWLKSIRSAAGVIQRVKAHLEAVAICRVGAYPSAVMTGLRMDEIPDEILLDEALLPVPPDDEMLARCRALGIRIPQRYQAHPAETDTPAETGTSEDGTRHTQANADSSEE
jgi:HK97 family phage prohead protease